MLYLASQMLNRAVNKFSPVYADANKRIRDVISVYLRSRRYEVTGLTGDKYTTAVRKLFSGPKWDKVVKQITNILYVADRHAVDLINDTLAETYAEGANVTLYQIEHQLGRKIDTLPYTEKAVLAMVDAGMIRLNMKTINENKDRRWCVSKVHSAVSSIGAHQLKFDRLAEYLANRIVGGMEKSMHSVAETVISGQYDDSLYEIGEEVARYGVAIDKTWLAIMDMNVRDSHRHLNNTTIPINATFMSYHGPIRFPHDPQAAAEEICGCRCRLAVHVHGKAPKYFKSRILPTETTAYRKWRDQTISELGGEVELIRMHLERRK